MNTSVVYFFGFLLVIAAVAYGAVTLGVPPLWVGIGAVALVGIALMSTVTHTKRRELPGDEREVTRTTVRRD